MADGTITKYDVNNVEKKFIKNSGLKVRPGVLRDNTLGYYTPAYHTLTLAVPDASTFYHELGHSIDYRFIHNPKRLSDTVAREALGQDKVTIAMNRLRDSKKNMAEAELKKYVMGERAKFTTAGGRVLYTKIDPGYHRYMMSHTELFAEAYAQYRRDPTGFAKQAPAITKIIEELGL
jgi:hypothetical protein